MTRRVRIALAIVALAAIGACSPGPGRDCTDVGGHVVCYPGN